MRFFGIPVRFDFSAPVLWVMGSVFMEQRILGVAGLPFITRLLVYAAGGILLVLSILWHERVHILAASSYGIGCRGIVLFAFGGMALLKEAPNTSRASFWIAIAGPIASFIAAAGLFVVYRLLATMLPMDVILGRALLTFALFNLVLCMFNLIPIFPLDGGRVLYSILWRVKRDESIARRL